MAVHDVTFSTAEVDQIASLSKAKDGFGHASSFVDTFQVLRNYRDQLQTLRRKKNFTKLALLYRDFLLHDSAVRFEVTRRYDAENVQVCVQATKPIAEGDTIPCLKAVIARVPNDKVRELDQAGKDFSLAKTFANVCLLLGPLRFVNHDCKPNCRLEGDYERGLLRATAVEAIQEGEELTLSYGREYFSAGNQPCLCQTCCPVKPNQEEVSGTETTIKVETPSPSSWLAPCAPQANLASTKHQEPVKTPSDVDDCLEHVDFSPFLRSQESDEP